jgi:UDP-N-acetylglucosamine 1-carboxyvinyltransferase
MLAERTLLARARPRIIIEGVEECTAVEYRIIPDRIEAGTFMVAAAITNGDLKLENCRLDHLMAFVDRLSQVGVTVERNGDLVEVASSRRLEPIEVTTQPFPGMPTDLQAQLRRCFAWPTGTASSPKRFPGPIYACGRS